MKVEDKMTRNMVAVNIWATAAVAAKEMASEKVGTVLVLDGGLLKGIVIDRQIATKVVSSGKDPAKIGVSEFMTKDPITVSPEMDIHDAVRIMGSQGYRRIPVSKEGKPIGILSVADIAEHAKTCNLCMQNIFKELTKAER